MVCHFVNLITFHFPIQLFPAKCTACRVLCDTTSASAVGARFQRYKRPVTLRTQGKVTVSGLLRRRLEAISHLFRLPVCFPPEDGEQASGPTHQRVTAVSATSTKVEEGREAQFFISVLYPAAPNPAPYSSRNDVV